MAALLEISFCNRLIFCLTSGDPSVLAYIFKIERGEETEYPDFELPEDMSFDEYGKTLTKNMEKK